MPGLGGLGFLLQIRADARYADVPVTIVTGDYCIEGTTDSAVAALGASIRFKPLEVEEILRVVHEMVDGRVRPLPAVDLRP